MNDIEKRARELLAKVHADAGWSGLANEIRLNATFDIDHGLALAAIRAALTPPEGYMLAAAARAALPFIAYAFDQGVDGAEQAGRAIEAALLANQPVGYVLVPVRPTDAMRDAVESIKMPHAYLRTGIRIADFHERYSAMLAARPEVTP